MWVRRYTFILMITLASGTSVQASDPAQDSRDAQRAAAAPARAARLENEARLSQVIRSMMREMELLRASEDEAERRNLQEMHRAHLHEALMLLRATGADTMPDVLRPHVSDSSGAKDADSRSDAVLEERIVDLERRVEMLQMVLEATLDHISMPGRVRQ